MPFVRVNLTDRSIIGGIFIVLGAILIWLVGFIASILASAILVDALWHLGRWLLGW